MTAAVAATAGRKKFSRRYHIDWLLSMLWGGVLMLIVEHIAHREIVPYPPFFTAGFSHIFPEVLRVGIPMTLAILAVWGIMVYIGERVAKAKEKGVKLVEG
jgi:hypothetical protein